MQLILLDLFAAQELIDNVLSHVEALWFQAEFAMHIDDPFQEERPRSVPDLCLNLGDVLGVNHEPEFLVLHVFVVLLRVFGDRLRISHLLPIHKRHIHHFSF